MRTERVRNRRNFLPALLLDTVLTLMWAVIFLSVPPETPLLPIAFLLLTALVTLFTGALLFGNTRRGVLASFGVTGFLVLGYFGAGHWLNLVLIAAVCIALGYYLSR